MKTVRLLYFISFVSLIAPILVANHEGEEKVSVDLLCEESDSMRMRRELREIFYPVERVEQEREELERVRAECNAKIQKALRIARFKSNPAFERLSGRIKKYSLRLACKNRSLDTRFNGAQTLLIDACRKGNVDDVKALLALGANPNATGFHRRMEIFYTPLCIAEENKHRGIVQVLVNAGGKNFKNIVDLV